MPERRLKDLVRFYSILHQLQCRLGGSRRLETCSGRMAWPQRGVYFFFEEGEVRRDTGDGPRVVRVGTHALRPTSRTSLWQRLSQHRGVGRSGGGNHRGSVFRHHVGGAILNRFTDLKCMSWGLGNSAAPEVRQQEQPLELIVSRVIRNMPFLWLEVEDPAGPDSERGSMERNTIALLSNYRKLPLDAASEAWLGLRCPSERVRNSGLWNSNHVDEAYDASFLDRFGELVAAAGRS